MRNRPGPRCSRRARTPYTAFCTAVSLLLALSLSTVMPASAQGVEVASGGTIVGRVTDAGTRQGIVSATVQVDRSRFAAVTSEDGHYRITGVPAGPHTITARRIGYTQHSVPITVVADSELTVDFALQPATTSLDQIVVTGTPGGEQRRSIGNSVTEINAADEQDKSRSPELGDLLRGRAPGVTVNTNTGRLGAGPIVEIRGMSSLGLSNIPLLYVDGVRVDNSSNTGPVQIGFGSQNSQVANRLNDINPEDIESIEIIKGPAAATIYGTEGSNGVIQIITKKGSGTKPVWRLGVQGGAIYFRDPAGRLPTNFVPDGTGSFPSWNGVTSEADSGRKLFTTGSDQLYNLALSGGAASVNYYLSGTYQNDKGVEPNNKAEQFSAHANVNVAATPKVDVGTSLNFVRMNNHLGVDGGVSAMLGAELGHIDIFPGGRGFFPNQPPEIPQTLYDNADFVNRFTGSVTFNHRPLNWLSHRLIVGMDYTSETGQSLERFAPPNLAALLSPLSAAGTIAQVLRHNTLVSADYSATAKFNVTSSLTSSTSLGGQYYRTQQDTAFLGGQGFAGPGSEAISATATPLQSSQDRILNTTVGGYGQEQLAWNDRLFLTGALRVDNNSAFGENFKWITYPKVSASWVVSEEPFWHSNFINTLHLRAAYGESGRAPNVFSALRTYVPIQGAGGLIAITAGSIGNPGLKPERGKEVELGFEAQMFKRLSLDFTYYNKHTVDEIVAQPIAPSSGFPGVQFLNIGQVNNHGVELQATFEAIRGSNFGWSITGNIGTANNKIVSLGDLPSVVGPGQNNALGFPISSYFAKKVVSADRDPTTGLATNVLCDGGSGSASVSCADAPFVYVGSPTPTVTGSIGNTFSFGKRLRLYALVDFKHGNRLYNAIEELRCAGEIGIGLCDANYHPENYPIRYIAETDPALATTGSNDEFIQDASFAKLREISLTYSLPERFIPGVTTASVTLAARELHTWTKYRGPDPEVNINANGGVSGTYFDQGLLPPLSRFTASLNITF
jgi:TonB-dependent SusC/RagA subfamily outer membrane receptor